MADSPWLNVKQARAYIARSPRFIARTVRRGELRSAEVGDRKELYFLAAWLDEYMLGLATPAAMHRRAGYVR